MHFIAYTRVSTTEQGQSRNGLDSQEASIRRFIEAEGHTLLALHVEVASGSLELSDRPVLAAAMAEATRTKSTLLVSKLDRLSRDAAFVLDLMKRKVKFATVEDGLDVDPFMLHIKAVFAEKERKIISERTKAGLAAAKAKGVVMGWAAHKDVATSRTLAQLRSARTAGKQADSFASSKATTIKALQASGMTYAQIADELNATGVRTARNGVWVASTVCRVLKRL